MKRKLTSILIIAVVSLLTFFGSLSSTFGDSASASGKSTYLVNPSGICVTPDCIYISDKVTDKETVIQVFTNDNDTTLVSTLNIDRQVNRLYAVGNKFYCICSDGFVYGSFDLATKTYQQNFFAFKGCVDITTFTYTNDTVTTEYLLLLTKSGIYICDLLQNTTTPIYEELNNATFFYSEGNSIYIFADKSAKITKNDLTFVKSDYDTPFLNAIGYLNLVGETKYYSATEIQTNSTTSITLTDNKILSASSDVSSNIFVLLSNRKVVKYHTVEGNYIIDSNFGIGSDTVNLDVINDFSDITFDICASKGYPSNIVYKTNDSSTSVDEIVTLNTTDKFLIIKDNIDRDYYYVFYNGKFGWIKKSAPQLTSDSAINIINTKVSDEGTVLGKTLNFNTTLYTIPYNIERYSLTTRLPKDTPITLIDKIDGVTTKDSNWYYISYIESEQTKFAFIKKGDIGQFSIKPKSTTVIENKKINAPLSGTVPLYISESLSEGEQVTDTNGKTIGIRAETLVYVIKNGESSTLISVYVDDILYYGYVSNNFLIPESHLSDYTIIGLSLLGVALLLTATFVIVILARRHTKRAQATSSQSDLSAFDEHNDN